MVKRKKDVGAADAGVNTAKPSALKMLRVRKTGRKRTLSVALPASIVENAQGGELKALLVGQIARALTIYGVDEVVIYEDRSEAAMSDQEGVSNGMAFFARNLQYLETPQYLRKQLVPVHRDLKWVGLLAPLDAPHHLRKHEQLPYREGVVLKRGWPPPEGGAQGSWVNCGLPEPVWLEGKPLEPHLRLTVRLLENGQGVAVKPSEPRESCGLYWGFQTRLAQGLKQVFEECPYGSYDLTIGTSERGEALGMGRLPSFQHLLLAFGGLGGFEEVVKDPRSGVKGDPKKLFSRYVNVCPRQKSRTIRTEEALFIALASLDPLLPDS